jgi:hypothetical protein
VQYTDRAQHTGLGRRRRTGACKQPSGRVNKLGYLPLPALPCDGKRQYCHLDPARLNSSGHRNRVELRVVMGWVGGRRRSRSLFGKCLGMNLHAESAKRAPFRRGQSKQRKPTKLPLPLPLTLQAQATFNQTQRALIHIMAAQNIPVSPENRQLLEEVRLVRPSKAQV